MVRAFISVILSFLLAFTGFIPPHISFAQDRNEYTIAVLDLEANGVSIVEAKGLSEKILSRISWVVNTDLYINTIGTAKYLVVERTQMDKIFEQFDIQNIGCTDESCAVEFGKMLQADKIIIGSVNLIGRTYNITTRMIDVETGKTITVSEEDYRGSIDGLLGSTINDVADELILGYSYKDWEKSENIFISGNPEKANVSINGKNIGITPIQNKMIPLGNNSVRIKKSGYDDYNEKIRIEKGNPIKLTYLLIPKTRKRTFIKSIFFPGSGQRYAEYKVKGYIISLLQLATIGGVVGTTTILINSQNEYDDAKDAYYNSATQDEYNKTYMNMEDKYDKASSAHTFQMISAGAAAAVYLYNIIDAALTEPKREDRFGEKRMFIEPRITKDFSSILVSMRF